MADKYTYEYRVHPAVGIARMGNSETTFFLGAEQPAQQFNPVQQVIPGQADQRGSGIRDSSADKKLCKQGARFRVFCYQRNARTKLIEKVWECTPADYEIQYSVTVANLKSSLGTSRPEVVTVHARTGSTLPVPLPNKPDRRNFSSADTARVVKKFTGKPAGRLDLGSAFMDTDGRLIVLGSNGAAKKISASAISADATHQASLAGAALGDPYKLYSAGFEDDAADGPVEASVIPKSTSTKQDKADGVSGSQTALAAWIVIGVPDYAPDVRGTTMLYDIAINHAYDMAINRGVGYKLPNIDAFKTFSATVRPLYRAQYGMPYVIAMPSEADDNNAVHRGRRPFQLPAFAAAGNKDLDRWLRPASTTGAIKPESIWEAYAVGGNAYTAPGDPAPVVYRQSRTVAPLYVGHSMPNLEYTSITEMQFRAVAAWAGGTLTAGNPAEFTLADDMYRPYQLDRAALESMSGGSFYPGIEVGRQAHWPKTWQGYDGAVAAHYDVRVARRVMDNGKASGVATPGYLTEFLACPWQADFVACDYTFWPDSRPITVQQTVSSPGVKPNLKIWMSDGTAAGGADTYNDNFATAPTDSGAAVTGGLFSNWWKLGFVVVDATVPANVQLIEKHRHSTIGISNPPAIP